MSRPQADPNAQPPLFVVDAMVLAHGGLTWEREFSEVRFERLADMALSVTPLVSIKLKFGIVDKRPVVHGQLRATIELMCQRCMNPIQYESGETFELMLIENDAELELVPESHEPWIANSSRLNVLDLVEEQLLLALPLIAKHGDERDCVEVADSIEVQQPPAMSTLDVEADPLSVEVQRPFGNLRQLLRKD